MTSNERLAMVVRLACLTEDRTDEEQRALLAVAWACDKVHNRQTTSNTARMQPGYQMQDLVTLVGQTRVLDDGQRPVPPPDGWLRTWARWEQDARIIDGLREAVASRG